MGARYPGRPVPARSRYRSPAPGRGQVVGVSGGVRPWDYEKYITPVKDQALPVLNSDRWVLEIYRTAIGTAQSITWMLLIFFVFALIAYVLLRGAEMRHPKPL